MLSLAVQRKQIHFFLSTFSQLLVPLNLSQCSGDTWPRNPQAVSVLLRGLTQAMAQPKRAISITETKPCV